MNDSNSEQKQSQSDYEKLLEKKKKDYEDKGIDYAKAESILTSEEIEKRKQKRG